MRYSEAIDHLITVKRQYQELPPQSSWFVLEQIRKLEARWDDGERTQQLYDEIMAME
jgi:hypothetical protein